MLHSRLAEGIQPVDGSLADYEELCYEGVFRFFLPQHYIYDHKHQLVTVSHRLFRCDNDTQDNTMPSGNFVENESLLELATQIGENDRLHNDLWTINCYIRPSTIGVYLLYVFSKTNFYKHNLTKVAQIEFRRGEQKTEIASQILDMLCMLKIVVRKSWPNPQPFPAGSSHIWGRIHWNEFGFQFYATFSSPHIAHIFVQFKFSYVTTVFMDGDSG
ncbi:hypothetical protein EG68_11168 [Paragonimus skrjabini miyazakii]|uniref:Uncharacterized protein n=1 Tax=Paragonimus skrjabini miyazakii TaxID=59628 RepID=A0A8S9YER5_9TREM|nr:hypothetical protein EG68_11168 [Paragonimus skrjabini miyazakii]